jgi:hypothetical protein
MAYIINGAVLLLSISGCTTVSYQSRESRESLTPGNNISQLAATDPLNQCDEKTRMLKHEIALCRAVPLITVPLE